MTAYARAERAAACAHLVCEIRSVNHRYLEPTFRLPETVRFAEPALRERVRARLHRGKLDCTLRVDRERAAALDVDAASLDALALALERIAAHLPRAAPVSPIEVLRWPGVVREPAPDADALDAGVRAVFDEALDALVAHREREGAILAEVLDERLAAVTAEVAAIEGRAAATIAAQRERLASRVRALVSEVEPNRLEQELVLLAQKADVAEELDRLRAHVSEMRSTLARHEGPAGRRLDFLAQELNREANTIASKSTDAEVTRRAVDLKVTIDQIREQIQNVE